MLRGVAQWVRFAEIDAAVPGVVGGLELPGERVGYDWVIGVFAHCGPPYRGAVVRGRDVCGAPNEEGRPSFELSRRGFDAAIVLRGERR